jgi:DNA-binding LacI/PurR family transcriptional regulator
MAPKYMVLAETLKSSIGKEFASGDKLPTQRALMKRYDVSLTTVERALRILADEQVVSCHVGRGTFVTKKAATGKKCGVGSVCMISMLPGPDIASNWYQGHIFEGIRSVLEEAGINLMLSDDGIDDINRYNAFSGLIFMAPKEDKKKFVEKFQNSGIPSVIISTSWEDVDIPSVDCDNEYGIRCALRYLTDRGHTRIGYVDQVFQSFDALARRSAFEKLTDKFGIEAAVEKRIAINFDRLDDEALSGLKKVFDSERRPTALVFSSLFLPTMQIVSELRNMGLSVPEDVSIIGFDDSSWARWMDPALTVIRQPLSTMGRHAAERLLDQMDDKPYIKNEILPIELIERSSVAVVKSPRMGGVAIAR